MEKSGSRTLVNQQDWLDPWPRATLRGRHQGTEATLGEGGDTQRLGGKASRTNESSGQALARGRCRGVQEGQTDLWAPVSPPETAQGCVSS